MELLKAAREVHNRNLELQAEAKRQERLRLEADLLDRLVKLLRQINNGEDIPLSPEEYRFLPDTELPTMVLNGDNLVLAYWKGTDDLLVLIEDKTNYETPGPILRWRRFWSLQQLAEAEPFVYRWNDNLNSIRLPGYNKTP